METKAKLKKAPSMETTPQMKTKAVKKASSVETKETMKAKPNVTKALPIETKTAVSTSLTSTVSASTTTAFAIPSCSTQPHGLATDNTGCKHPLSIDAALKSPKKQKVSLEVKVTKVQDTIKVKDGTLDLKKLKVKDSSGMKTEVALWRSKAALQVKQGSPVKISGLLQGTYNKEPVFSSTQVTTIEPSNNKDIVDMLLSDDDEDDTNVAPKRDLQQLYGSLIGIQSVECYKACLLKTCKLKKLDDDNICQRCQMTYGGDTGMGVVARVGATFGAKLEVYTIFNNVIEKIVGSVHGLSEETIKQNLAAELPFSGEFSLNPGLLIIQDIV